MSAAVPVYQMATGRRLAYEHSYFGYHAIKFTFSRDATNYADFKKKAIELMNADITQKAYLPAEWFPLNDLAIIVDAKRAKELNIIDEIITQGVDQASF